MNRCSAGVVAAVLALGLVPVAVTPASALELWLGRTYTFTKLDNADWTQPANQDRITNLVWITRKNTQGLYNIAQETAYNSLAPAGTEWATGDAVQYATLTFQPWVLWANNNPPGTVGLNAVVHLIAEDIYIDIRFDSWTGSTLGGGFSYTRAMPPVVGAERATWGRIKALFR